MIQKILLYYYLVTFLRLIAIFFGDFTFKIIQRLRLFFMFEFVHCGIQLHLACTERYIAVLK